MHASAVPISYQEKCRWTGKVLISCLQSLCTPNNARDPRQRWTDTIGKGGEMTGQTSHQFNLVLVTFQKSKENPTWNTAMHKKISLSQGVNMMISACGTVNFWINMSTCSRSLINCRLRIKS
ncbi:unnamed protein product [Knipowitschia caucasica]|uniref:Uncharacterized protein n=1 Tax=Knipowitschia caucasica TaxID=637954 RepID=A0AAV2L1K7_KNICA